MPVAGSYLVYGPGSRGRYDKLSQHVTMASSCLTEHSYIFSIKVWTEPQPSTKHSHPAWSEDISTISMPTAFPVIDKPLESREGKRSKAEFIFKTQTHSPLTDTHPMHTQELSWKAEQGIWNDGLNHLDAYAKLPYKPCSLIGHTQLGLKAVCFGCYKAVMNWGEKRELGGEKCKKGTFGGRKEGSYLI